MAGEGELLLQPEGGTGSLKGRAIARRSVVRAVVITLPVVAAFAQNLSATSVCHTPMGMVKPCGMLMASEGPLGTSSLVQQNSFMKAPFDSSDPGGLKDGGFKKSPWK